MVIIKHLVSFYCLYFDLYSMLASIQFWNSRDCKLYFPLERREGHFWFHFFWGTMLIWNQFYFQVKFNTNVVYILISPLFIIHCPPNKGPLPQITNKCPEIGKHRTIHLSVYDCMRQRSARLGFTARFRIMALFVCLKARLGKLELSMWTESIYNKDRVSNPEQKNRYSFDQYSDRVV